jgi:hypothetical protein
VDSVSAGHDLVSKRSLMPARSRRVTQDLTVSPIYDAVFWNPPQKYKFKNSRPKPPRAVKVYEAHGLSHPALSYICADSMYANSRNLDPRAEDWDVQGVHQGSAA